MKAALIQALLVGAGGFLGSIARFGVGRLVYRSVPFTTFPWGTFAVNVSGCLLLGLLAGLGEARELFSNETRLFLFIGVLGGFTTFSTFGYETVVLLRDAAWGQAAANVSLNVLVGIGAAWLGLTLGRGW